MLDEAFDRADRKIDAAGDDDEGLAQRQYGDEGGLAQQLEMLMAVQNVPSYRARGTSHISASRPSRVKPRRM